MTIKKRLLLNMGVTIVGIAAIATASFLGLNTVREKIQALTAKSTPFQIKTLELTKELQEHAVNLFAVSSSIADHQLESAAGDAEETLKKISHTSSELQALRGEKENSASSILQEITGLTKEMVNISKERIRTEKEASEAVSLTKSKLGDTMQRLDNLQRSMKALQGSTVENLMRSSKKSKQITGELGNVQKIKDATQELQMALTEINVASTPAVVNTAKGRIRFALQNVAQSGNRDKQMTELFQEFEKMTIDPKGLADRKDALLSGSATAKQEDEFKNAYQRCKNKMDNLVMAVNEALDGTSLSYQAENIALDGTIKASEGVHQIMVVNNDLVHTGFAIQNLVSALFASNSVDQIEAVKISLSDKFGLARRLSGKAERALSTAGKKTEISIMKQVTSAFKEIETTLTAPGGVTDKLKRTAEARVHSMIMNAKLNRTIEEQKEKGGKTMALAYKDQTEAVGTVNLVVKMVTITVLVIGLAVLVTGIAFSKITERSVMRPVKSLIALADRFGKGDFSMKMDDSRRDEFGAVAADFNIASSKIRAMASSMSNLSEHLFSSSKQLIFTAEMLSLGAGKQSEGTERSVSAITEMALTNTEMARNTRQSAEKAVEMKRLALDGKETLHATATELLNFADTVDLMSKKMDGFSTKSQDVHGISDMIQEIAEQTNLLSLNAAIEAARAGGAGRGFAVVADSVRALSEKVSSSARQIDKLTDAMLADLAASVQTMDLQKTSIDNVLLRLKDTGNAMESIVKSVEQVSDMVQATAVATEQHSLTSEDISKAMERMAATTKDLNRSIKEIEEQAEGLVSIATDLEDKVGWFKTDEDMREITSIPLEDSLTTRLRVDSLPALTA